MDLRVAAGRAFRTARILALLAGIAGCTPAHWPLVADEHYPAKWPALPGAAEPGRAVTGEYEDAGVLVSSDGDETTIRLGELLRLPFESAHLSLFVLDEDGRVPQVHGCRLEVRPSGHREIGKEFPDCFCAGGTVGIPAVEQSGAVAPFGIFGGQTNVWLRIAADGSLVAFREMASAGLISVVPFSSSHEAWARFAPVPPEARSTATDPARTPWPDFAGRHEDSR